MSMSEPLLPHPSTHVDGTAAAEPGPGGPPPAAPEEPDVLAGDPAGEEAAAAEEDKPRPDFSAETPFRTPTPGARLHPEDLADDGP